MMPFGKEELFVAGASWIDEFCLMRQNLRISPSPANYFWFVIVMVFGFASRQFFESLGMVGSSKLLSTS